MSSGQEADDYRALLYQRQSIINTKYVSDLSLSACTRYLIGGVSDVLIAKRGEKIGYKHLQTCKKRWLCPICADRMARQSRERLLRALNAESACGYFPLFVTYTAQHKMGEPLATGIKHVAGAHRLVHSGVFFHEAAKRLDYDGSFRALEITYGAAGWHFHIHELAFIGGSQARGGLADVLLARWPSAVAKMGGYASPENGIDTSYADATVRDYIIKFGIVAELTQGVQKYKTDGGLLPFQLADVPITEPKRTKWAATLFGEYAAATRGLQQSCSGGSLRALFRHIRDNPTEKDYQTDILATLSVDEWRAVARAGKRAALLRSVEQGDRESFELITGRSHIVNSGVL